MTNEMLAEFIQQGGNDELIPILWNNVKVLVYTLSDRLYRAYSERFKQYGIELWDIKQASYRAFLQAIQGYKAEKGYKFTSYLTYPIKNIVSKELLGNKDLLNSCISLDMPLTDKDHSESDNTLIDTVSDENAVPVEYKSEQESENEYIWQIVDTLPQKLRDVIKARYLDNMTLKQIGERLNVSGERIRQLEHQALKQLRENKNIQLLAKEYRQHNRWISFSRFEYSPEYFDIINSLRERENKGEYISYGNRQAIIYSYKIKYEEQEQMAYKC